MTATRSPARSRRRAAASIVVVLPAPRNPPMAIKRIAESPPNVIERSARNRFHDRAVLDDRFPDNRLSRVRVSAAHCVAEPRAVRDGRTSPTAWLPSREVNPLERSDIHDRRRTRRAAGVGTEAGDGNEETESWL